MQPTSIDTSTPQHMPRKPSARNTPMGATGVNGSALLQGLHTFPVDAVVDTGQRPRTDPMGHPPSRSGAGGGLLRTVHPATSAFVAFALLSLVRRRAHRTFTLDGRRTGLGHPRDWTSPGRLPMADRGRGHRDQ